MSSIVTTDGREVRTRGQKTRARLLAAGAAVFADQGFHAARVDDIVKAARTSHGTFYVYFASKEALFDELVTEVGAEMTELVAELPDLSGRDGTARAALRDWLERFGAFYERSGAVLQAWSEVETPTEGAPDAPSAITAGAEFLAAMAEALGPTLVASGSKGPRRDATIDPGLAALALLAMIERFHYYVSTGQMKADREEVLETLTDLVAATLSA
jgi:AcrR family transcriptional regulator